MSIAITTSPQLVQYFGNTKDISNLTNMDNVQEMVTIENGNYKSWTPDFAGFTQFKQGDGYLIFSNSTAPETYTIDAADSAETRPSSTSVAAAKAIKLYVGGTVDLLDASNITNYESIYRIDSGGNYQAYLKSNVVDENGVRLTGDNDKSNFNGFNSLLDSETYLIFSDSSFSFDNGNTYPWATFTSGNSMYAICPDENLVKVLDTSGHSVSATIEVGEEPVDMVMVDDFIYVVNKISQTISIIDAGTNTVVDTILLYSGIGRGSFQFTFRPSFIEVFQDSGDTLLVVSSETNGTVLVIDIDTRDIVERVDLGGDINNVSSMYLANKLSSTDDRIIYLSDDSTNQILRVEDKKTFEVLGYPLRGGLPNSHYGHVVAISRNGKHFATTSSDRQSVDGYILNNNMWEFRGSYTHPDYANISALSISDDGHIGIGWRSKYVGGT
jgi:YVTN family beta-propeller protein